MWWIIGFIFHEMAFGLLSVFIPLYVTGYLGGSLIDVGIMISLANFVVVPFSFFWGYLSDKTRRYRFFILLSFSMLSVLLFLFSSTRVVSTLVGLYVAVAVFHVAHEAPKNVLISEYYSRPEWERSFASYEALTEVGWLSGLLLGFVFSGFGFSGASLILLCSLLNAIAFFASLFLVKDPLLVFERRLVAIERVVDFAHRGFSVAFKAIDGKRVREKLKNESALLFCTGLLLFSLSTSMLFTPLPVFFSKNLGVSSNIVFGVFMFNTFGGVLGYVASRKKAQQFNVRTVVKRANLVRAVLPLLLVAAEVWFSVFTLALATVVLMIMGIAYGFFLISTLSLSMELIPEGKTGVFNALVGLGGALGCFLGTYVAENYGFQTLFMATSAVFFLSYMVFKAFSN
ncbi:MAG: MFS transporter [Candidatus Bathyarchaeia archaeon]|jgi:MFS family permease|nr:MFS transporter [Candidatus Bathyarchaeota archaeon A05DMB-4]MDH7594707.1 MFS transporter [Candidatus Bathyarchaeota archaeon]